MPIKHAIWTVGNEPTPLPVTRLASEQMLEDMIERDPRILSEQWMLIGRQLITPNGGRIDLLAIAPDASLVLIELKRDKTPRDIVAQALDYATWVEKLSPEEIAALYRKYSQGQSLDQAFKDRFGIELDEDELNGSHQIILCASEMDAATERIVGYLNDKDIPINVLFFQVFQHGETPLLSRTWMIDPAETQENVATASSSQRAREPWNGEFYCSFGDGQGRSWEEASQYGFFSAGGGAWYSQTLKMLKEGDLIWVRIPKEGYVGVGRVEAPALQANEFTFETPDGPKPALELLKKADYHRAAAEDPDNAEYFVKVNWLQTVPAKQAFHEVGFFGNQNSVCKPATPKWRQTTDRLKERFTNWKG
jgi:uncharacterized protein YeaO (DUF488 family)